MGECIAIAALKTSRLKALRVSVCQREAGHVDGLSVRNRGVVDCHVAAAAGRGHRALQVARAYLEPGARSVVIASPSPGATPAAEDDP